MRWFLVGGTLLALASLARAQEPQELTLRVKVEDAMLIVQTLGAIQCGTVVQLAVCQRAWELLRSIQDQAKAQAK